ncbi:MAG: diacylglycerol kinase family lipid kinase [Clostridia bacterium]|jgi:diacylglycerol kinase (ATP)|nr:diacylglycerol kinase family lipid kinase [Clostridia bacterium]MBT7123519.1 diacylglycerol kinase family lipid kinase [Clostridia bacterium]
MYYLIFNPTAGAGRSKKTLQIVEEYCKARGKKYELAQTERIGHATQLASSAVGKGYSGIISVGGDGTILEIAEALKDTDENLGVVPAGTGNDFKYAINVPQDTKGALDVIFAGNTKRIDIGVLNDDKCFLNIVGTGFDVDVIKNTNKVRRFLTGGGAYYIGIVLSIFGYKNARLEITMDGKTIKRTALLIAVANGQCYGGGLFVNPSADLTNGKLNFIVINKIAKYKILLELPKLQKAQPELVKELESFSCSEVTITSEKPRIFNVDGDLFGQTPMNIKVKSKALNVFCPK